MASTWAPGARDGQHQLQNLGTKAPAADQNIALVEGCVDCSEQELRARLAPYGSIAWCNAVGEGRYLVRYLEKESTAAAVQALDGASWNGSTVKIAPYSVGHMQGLPPVNSPMARVESIPAVLPDQLDYFDMLVAEEAGQAAQQQHARLGQPANMFTGPFPELEPCHSEWTSGIAGTDMPTPLEDEVLSMEDSLMNSFASGSGLSTSQLWTQRSIGAVARKDLAKIAAMQSLAQQHSNSSTPTPGLMAGGSLCVGSPWGSFSAGSRSTSAAELPMAGLVRRVSSPAGHSGFATPSSSCSFVGGQEGAAGVPDMQGLQLQPGGVAAGGAANSSSSSWPTHLMHLPSDLGLGDSCGDAPAGLTQQQRQQLLMQPSFGAEVMSPALSCSSLGPNASGGFGSGDVLGRGMGEGSGSDVAGMLGGVMQPPPSRLLGQQQQGTMGAPPPPPPRGNGEGHGSYNAADGRLSGSASPVPAPPPRALTPSGCSATGQAWSPSPAASPRFAGPAQQPISPGGGVRPPRVATRLFQPGMSNLGHTNWGGQGYVEQQGPGSGPGYPHHQQQQQQQQQQPMLPTGAFNQPPMQPCQQPVPPPYGNRAGSPVTRGLPPPPPPGMPPAGYAASAAAAAANGICGSPVPPCSPAGGRLGSGVPLHGMSSCPASMLESMASGSSQGIGARSPCYAGPPPLAGHNYAGAALTDRPDSCNMAQQAAAGGMMAQGRYGAQQQQQAPQAAEAAPAFTMWKADGSLFIQELLQLLQGGAAAGNSFLCNLRDLLECVVAAAVTDRGSATAETVSINSTCDKRAAAVAEAAKAAPVDAAAFLGMLQEAAAPLMAAAAVARTSSLGQQPGRRGCVRLSESSESGSSMGGSCAAPGAGGTRSPACSTNAEPGKGLKLIRTTTGDRSSSAGTEHGADVDTPPGLLLRQQLSGRAGGACSQPGSPSAAQLQLLYPLHPRTTTNGGRDTGGAPQPGTPMLLVPQTLPELLAARAALLRLMVSAHGFMQSPQYRGMAARLERVGAVYDSMHDDPVVVKRRKCREMAAMRELIRQDAAFVQAVSSLSSLRNHIYSLSRKVLIGYGHVEGLPVDLLLGGLTSELTAILTDPSGQPPPGMAAAAAAAAADRDAASAAASEPGSGVAGAAAAAAAGSRSEGGAGGGAGPQGTLPQHVLDFFTCVLPLPKLALLVFTEFVAVDPAPCGGPAPLPGTAGGSIGIGAAADLGAVAGDVSGRTGSAGGGSSGGNMAGNGSGQRGSSLRHSRRSSSSAEGAAEGREAGGSAQQGERRGSYRRSRDDDKHGSSSSHGRDRTERDDSDRHGSSGSSRGGRAQGSFSGNGSSGSPGGAPEGSSGGAGSSGSGSGSGRQRTQRRSQQCEYDMVAEAAALEAAATAAAPLVAAAVCDLPTGRKNRTSGTDAC